VARLNNSTRPLKRVTRTSVADSAYEAIRESILQGQYVPGEQLVEARLASELGVSRGPVREALSRLTEEGLLVDILHRGTFVRQLEAADLIDIYNVRIGLETVAVRLMIGSGQSIRPLASLVEDMRKAALANDLGRLSRLEFRFHEKLCELSGNTLLATLFRSISSQVQMALSLDNSSYVDPQEIAEEHVPLIEAMEAGDAELSVERITNHIVCSVEPLFARLYGDGDIPEAKRLLASVK
jgi:GntR family transcriptional regulator, gluconate operon transcriptional repressor